MKETIADVRDAIDRAVLRSVSASGGIGRVALVPTMGALHAGHMSLVHRARELAETVVVSLFVNPLQFESGDDLARYPVTLDDDRALLRSAGVDVIFAPSVAEMYPDGAVATRVSGGPVAAMYEGRARPGHFEGMLTVVSKLFSIVGPDIAVFGEKDAQQLFLVRQMVRDLNMPVDIESCVTVREEDGLALSSRNARLNPEERTAARCIPRALAAAENAAPRGVSAMLDAARIVCADDPLVKLDEIAVVNPQTFLSLDDCDSGDALVLIAAVVGTTRLIDNTTVYVSERVP